MASIEDFKPGDLARFADHSSWTTHYTNYANRTFLVKGVGKNKHGSGPYVYLSPITSHPDDSPGGWLNARKDTPYTGGFYPQDLIKL